MESALLILSCLLAITLVIVLVLLLSPSETKVHYYTPYGTIFTDIYQNNGSMIPLAVYFPLRQLSQLTSMENKAISQGSLTVAEIANTFGLTNDELKPRVQWLQQYGSVWVSPSKTSGILFIEDHQLSKMIQGKILYNNYVGVATQNNIFLAPYDMVIAINGVYDSKAARKTLQDYTKEYSLLNYNNQIKTADFLPITALMPRTAIAPESVSGDTIGIIAMGALDRHFLTRAAVSLGYPGDQFNNNITQIVINMNPTEPGYVEPEVLVVNEPGSILNPNNAETNLDAYTACATRPNSPVVMININTQNIQNSYTDPVPLFWSSGLKTISCSYGSNLAFDNSWAVRNAVEIRLLSLLGINIFQSSGDQGLTTLFNSKTLTTAMDITKPDTMVFFPNAITVGGISTSEFEKQQGNSYYLPMQFWSGGPTGATGGTGLFFKSPSFTTAGGYCRSIPRPEYKNIMAAEYRDSQLWRSATYLNKDTGMREMLANFEINFDGNIYPDISNFGNIYCEVQLSGTGSGPAAGTSFAAPLTASLFQIIIDQSRPIPCLQRQLYTDLKQFLTPRAVGNNGIFNINGYQSNLSTAWDPVNGLGMADYAAILQYFQGDSNLVGAAGDLE